MHKGRVRLSQGSIATTGWKVKRVAFDIIYRRSFGIVCHGQLRRLPCRSVDKYSTSLEILTTSLNILTDDARTRLKIRD
jgi:hypothetical protein